MTNDSSRSIYIAETAERDLIELWQWVASTSGEDAADEFLELMFEQAQRLVEFPDLGRDRSDLLANVRSIAVRRVLVFYRVTAEEIQVVRVLPGYRDIGGML